MLIRLVPFQSTHPRGVRRLIVKIISLMPKFQSTHPRGVRHTSINYQRLWEMFQSTHPRGVRPIRHKYVTTLLEFQSTHPRGVRLIVYESTANGTGFNPRTHVGCDILYRTFIWYKNLFQSTHPRGVRQHYAFRLSAAKVVSIHAPTWGATGLSRFFCTTLKVSIHAPTWGAT